MEEQPNFPLAEQGMDLQQYTGIVRGLSRSGASGQQCMHTWTPPLSHDREWQQLWILFAQLVLTWHLFQECPSLHWMMTYYICNQRGSLVMGSH